MSATRRAFVVGHPIAHSRSPLIHGHWLRQYAIDGDYLAVDVAPADFMSFVDRLRGGAEGFMGGNVTMPHKEAAMRLADDIDPSAARLGAGNTFWLEKDRLRLANTDGYGFLANLDAAVPAWDRAERAVVLGAGGASRAVVDAILQRGFTQVDIINRTVERARDLAGLFGAKARPYCLDDLQRRLAGAGLFVNTSSLGMDGSEVPQVDFTAMADGALVTDIVYAPLETPLLRAARHQGVAAVDGLGMLLHQAVPGFEKWFGRRPEVTDELRRIVVADLEAAH